MFKERCPVQMGSWDIPIRNGKHILLGALQPCRLPETRNLKWQLVFFLAGPNLLFLHIPPTTTLSFNLSLQLGLILSLSSNQLGVVKVTFSLVFLWFRCWFNFVRMSKLIAGKCNCWDCHRRQLRILEENILTWENQNQKVATQQHWG